MAKPAKIYKFGPGDIAWYWEQRMGNYELRTCTIMSRSKEPYGEESYEVQRPDDEFATQSARFLFASRDDAKRALCDHLASLVQLKKANLFAEAERVRQNKEELNYYASQLDMWKADSAAIPVKFERTAQDKLDYLIGSLELALIDCQDCKTKKCCNLCKRVTTVLNEVRGDK